MTIDPAMLRIITERAEQCKKQELIDHNDNIDRIARYLYEAFQASGRKGATVGCAGRCGCPERGYLASYADKEQQFKQGGFTVFDVRDYIANHHGRVSLTDFYGIWTFAGIVYLDVSRLFTYRDECVTFAEKNEQIAYWDCANKTDCDIRHA